MAESHIDEFARIVGGILAGGGGVAGVWAWLTAKAKAKAAQPADLLTAQTAFQQALNDQANAFTNSLLTLIGRHEATIAGLNTRVETLEGENEQCRGENRELRGLVNALRRELRAHGIEVTDEAAVDVAVTEHHGLTEFSAVRRVVKP